MCPQRSALDYVDAAEDRSGRSFRTQTAYEYEIASGGGRMVITMDRYEANWTMVEKGWHTHVHGRGPTVRLDAKEAIETYRAENPGMIDQDLPPFVIAARWQARRQRLKTATASSSSTSAATVRRRSPWPLTARTSTSLTAAIIPASIYAGMLEYDGDLKIPEHYLVEPPVIKNTLTEVLCKAGVHEYAVSETQKYGHVTYFWNGNRSGKVDESLEVYEEIPSDVIPFEQAPAMKSVEITDHLVAAMAVRQVPVPALQLPQRRHGRPHRRDSRQSFPRWSPSTQAVGRVMEAADKYGYTLLVTADHGNADQMTETKKGKTSIRTAHSLNPVPFIIYDKDNKFQIKDGHYGLANVAPTIVTMMGLQTPDCWQPSMI